MIRISLLLYKTEGKAMVAEKGHPQPLEKAKVAMEMPGNGMHL